MSKPKRRVHLSKPARLVYNFESYLERLILRVGLVKGRLVAMRHHSEVARVDVTVTCLRNGQTTQAPGSSRDYSLDELARMFQVRLNRLLKNLYFHFGTIVIDVEHSKIVELTFTISIRPHEGDTLKALFAA